MFSLVCLFTEEKYYKICVDLCRGGSLSRLVGPSMQTNPWELTDPCSPPCSIAAPAGSPAMSRLQKA